MATIHNEISINAPIEKIWDVLTEIELLDKYDPTLKKSTALSTVKKGIGAKRKVEMLDSLLIRKQSDSGLKKFFAGPKSYSEKH